MQIDPTILEYGSQVRMAVSLLAAVPTPYYKTMIKAGEMAMASGEFPPEKVREFMDSVELHSAAYNTAMAYRKVLKTEERNLLNAQVQGTEKQGDTQKNEGKKAHKKDSAESEKTP